jgi:hypothetical protein
MSTAVKRRTTERDMRIAALQVAASHPDGYVTTTELKEEIGKFVSLTDGDLSHSPTRNEPMYYQIVGNIVSHSVSSQSLFSQGYATYTGDGIRITDTGREFLASTGLL